MNGAVSVEIAELQCASNEVEDTLFVATFAFAL